mmetsp:Transcript_172454/g.552814  ORF Transcript_172454/g.552814 Transcript_172454/m.552814 type:complete len:117 (+) Transcript_172454:980-1330(+)
MSSGLILAATNFESHYYLQWQMCCYSIDREYFVLCHGSVLPAPHVLRLRGRILEGKHRVHARSSFGDRCHVHPRGKPAESRRWRTSPAMEGAGSCQLRTSIWARAMSPSAQSPSPS